MAAASKCFLCLCLRRNELFCMSCHTIFHFVLSLCDSSRSPLSLPGKWSRIRLWWGRARTPAFMICNKTDSLQSAEKCYLPLLLRTYMHLVPSKESPTCLTIWFCQYCAIEAPFRRNNWSSAVMISDPLGSERQSETAWLRLPAQWEQRKKLLQYVFKSDSTFRLMHINIDHSQRNVKVPCTVGCCGCLIHSGAFHYSSAALCRFLLLLRQIKS